MFVRRQLLRMDLLANMRRRRFMQVGSLASLGALMPDHWVLAASPAAAVTPRLAEFGYSDVSLADGLQEQQQRDTHALLVTLGDDSLLKPLREMAGLAAPGTGAKSVGYGFHIYRGLFSIRQWTAGRVHGHFS